MKEIKEAIKELDTKIDQHTEILARMDKTLAIQALQLETHMKRTQVAEDNLALLREEFKPIQNHVEFINKLSKLIALSATVGSALFGAFEVVKWFFHL